jgi:hypothetical protein
MRTLKDAIPVASIMVNGVGYLRGRDDAMIHLHFNYFIALLN